MGSRKQAFSLLEVVVALAMLALIAIPAIGLATMVVSQSKEQMNVSLASGIKDRVDMALRAQGSAEVFKTDFLPATVWGSSNLEFIDIEVDEEDLTQGNNQYYKAELVNPDGYSFAPSHTYRVVQYKITWPHNGSGADLNQAFFTSVFRK